MSETDGISEALSAEMRALVMAAAQVAEHAARHAETRARDLARHETDAAQQLQTRRAAERDTVRAAVAPTRDPRWWDNAQFDQAVRAYATAHAWADRDPNLTADTIRIAHHIADRFGPEARAAVETAVHIGRATPSPAQDVDEDRSNGRRPAEQQYATITAYDTAAAGWDSPARHATFAASLRAIPDPEAVDARIHLDRARAHPASTAVAAVAATAQTPLLTTVDRVVGSIER